MVFNAKEHLSQIKGKDYLEVKWRIVWFRDTYPNGAIRTDIQSMGEMAWVMATVTDGETLLSSGMATIRSANAKETTWSGREIEKAETAAIGRALAHAGFGTQFTSETENEGDYLPDSPVSGNGHSLNIAQLRANTRFMFDDDASHKTTVDFLLSSETITGKLSMDGAISHVLLTQASQKYAFEQAQVIEAINTTLTDDAQMGKYSDYINAGHTHEEAWAAITAFAELANEKPAEPKNGNPFLDKKTKQQPKSAADPKADAPNL